MRWLVLAILLGLVGCGGGPKTQFYTLVPEGPAAQADPPWHGRSLKVGHVELPADLDRASLVTLGPGPAMSVSDQDRWAAPLDELAQRALTEDLRARLGDAAVLAPADPVPPGGVRTVVLAVQRFSGDSAGQVILAADWAVANGNPPKPGPLHHVRIVEDAGSTQGSAVAAAMSRALGRLADQVARGVG